MSDAILDDVEAQVDGFVARTGAVSSNWSALHASPVKAQPPADSRTLERRIWSNWFLIAGLAVATTVGLAAGLWALVRGRADSPWPWNSTEQTLLLVLAAAMIALVAWLTIQQRHLAALRAENERIREDYLERMRRHYDRLMALLNVSQIMGTETDVQAIFDTITSTCLRTFECQQVSLMVAENAVAQAGELVVRSAAGHEVSILGARQKIGEGVAGAVAVTREPMVLGPAPFPDRPAADAPQAARLAAAMIVPILVRGELVGVLNVGTHRQGARYDDEDLRALQVFAENAGTCIRHAEQSHWMRQTIATLRTAR